MTVNDMMALHILRLKDEKKLSYRKIAIMSGLSDKTIRTFLNRETPAGSQERGITMMTADLLLKVLGSSWLEFVMFCKKEAENGKVQSW